MTKKASIIVLGICVLAPNCWAPIEQAPPKNHPLLQEAGQGQLAHEQQLQRTQGEVGYVPQKAVEGTEVTAEAGDHQAGSNLVTAQRQANQADAERAKKVLQGAEQNLQQPEGQGTNWTWGILFGIFGFGSVIGFRTWAAKNIPVPGGPKTKEPDEPILPNKNVW